MESPTDELVSSSTTVSAVDNPNDLRDTNKRIIEFVHDLKNAIESGQLKNGGSEQLDALNTSVESSNDPAAQTMTMTSQISNLMNVNNLSNHTFSYIINWLKNHQQKQTEPQPPTQSDALNNKVYKLLIRLIEIVNVT
jgi:hypothetical protein